MMSSKLIFVLLKSYTHHGTGRRFTAFDSAEINRIINSVDPDQSADHDQPTDLDRHCLPAQNTF